jgi:mRNA-degrading endonuclease HigB of HigAB toxin-antitoxin module
VGSELRGNVRNQRRAQRRCEALLTQILAAKERPKLLARLHDASELEVSNQARSVNRAFANAQNESFNPNNRRLFEVTENTLRLIDKVDVDCKQQRMTVSLVSGNR